MTTTIQSRIGRRMLNALAIGISAVLLSGCGTAIIYTPPSTPYYIGIKTIQYSHYSGLPTVVTVGSEYVEAFVTDASQATGGSVFNFPDVASGADGFLYLANAVAPAAWQFEYLSGACDGYHAQSFFQNHMLKDFECHFYAPVIQGLGYLIDGTPVNTGGTDQLVPNESLYPENVKTSADGRFHFKYQNDGNLVLYDQNWSGMWNSGTQGTCAGHTIMQNDGNLVVYDCNGSYVWFSGTQGHSGVGLVVQSDGNVVIYAQDTSALWSLAPADTEPARLLPAFTYGGRLTGNRRIIANFYIANLSRRRPGRE